VTVVSGEAKVLVERQGSSMIITLNRPGARNAVDGEVSRLVGGALTAADADPAVRAIIVTGSGDQAFCAGADLKAIMRGEPVLEPGREHWNFAGFVNHFTSKPTIAAVNGNALGGGTELALACDLVVAVNTASFGLPEVTRGLLPGAGGVFRLVEQLPFRVAMQMLLTGEPMTAQDALRWGLINQVVPPGEHLAAALELAVQASKRIAYGVQDKLRAGEAAKWEQTNAEFLALLATRDAAEGPRAFSEKRAPVWEAC
jgi:crotonobetainyl-CoA hydratase